MLKESPPLLGVNLFKLHRSDECRVGKSTGPCGRKKGGKLISMSEENRMSLSGTQ